MPTRDQQFLSTFGSPPPTLASDRPLPAGEVDKLVAPGLDPHYLLAYAARGTAKFFTRFNVEFQKSYVIAPTNQGQRGGIASRASMMYDPRRTPARMQYQQGYTAPIQLFASSNMWNSASGSDSKGYRMKQPSLKAVSPFAYLPIPTRMPWDL